jgi:hypothetical protein
MKPMFAVETSRTGIFPSLWRERATWLLLAIYLALVVRYAWNPMPFAEVLAAVGVASALAHCTLTYGWKNTLAFFAICLVVTFALENFGSLTGAALRFAAILFYAFPGLTHPTPWLMGQSGEVADATGHIWRIQDLRETTVAVMLFTMFFTSMLAALRLVRDEG